MPMSKKAKILAVFMLIGLMMGGAMAQPTDFDRVDDEGENVGDTAITHDPENEGSLYLPSEDSEETLTVSVDPDKDHEFDSDTEVQTDVTLYDDDGAEYNISEETVTPADEDNSTDVDEFDVEFEVEASELNDTLDLDSDIGFQSTTEYTDEETGDNVQVEEETWFTVTDQIGTFIGNLMESVIPAVLFVLLFVMVIKLLGYIPKALDDNMI